MQEISYKFFSLVLFNLTIVIFGRISLNISTKTMWHVSLFLQYNNSTEK